MADIEQSVTWKFRLDLSELSEAEKRVAALRQQVKEIERGAGGTTDVITQTNQRTRARDAETASVERNTRALDANSAAQRRAAIGGIGPRFGGGISPAVRPTDTGRMHGPYLPLPGTPEYAMWKLGPPTFPNRDPRALAPAVPASRYQPGNVANLPGLPPPPPIFFHDLPIPPRFNGQPGYNPAWLNQQLPQSPTRVGTSADGRIYMGVPGGPGYWPGGVGDPRGRLTGTMTLTPRYLAAAGFGPGGARSRFTGLQGSQFPNMLQAVMGFGAALDPGNSTSSRLAHAGYASSNFYYGGGLQTLRAVAGSTLGRASVAALPVAMYLEGGRRYYQGEADYQAQIGARYDAEFARRNVYRNYQSDLRNLRMEQRDARLGLYRSHADMQFQRGDSIIREESTFSRMRAGTYGDTVERIGVQADELRTKMAQQRRIKHNLERAQKRLAGARTDADKERLTRVVQEYQERYAATAEGIYDAQGRQQADVGGLMQARDDLRSYRDEWESGQSIRDRASFRYRRERDRMNKQIDDLDQKIASTEYGGFTIDEINRNFAAGQRFQIGNIQGAGRNARNLGDQADYMQGQREIAETYKEAASSLEEAMRELTAAIKQPPQEQRSGINAATHFTVGKIENGFDRIMDFFGRGE